MKKYLVLCRKSVLILDTFSEKIALNFQFANKALLFANKILFLRINPFIYE